MYECFQGKTVEGRETFSPLWIISENLLYLAMWVLAGALLWPLWLPGGWPLLTLTWAVIVIVIQVMLKKHICTGCYYYGKLCHTGWGKLASALFPPDSGNLKLGEKLTYFYIIPPPLILLAGIAYALICDAGWFYWLLLAFYVILNGLSFPLRIKGCGLCALREVCPGSAAKSKAAD